MKAYPSCQEKEGVSVQPLDSSEFSIQPEFVSFLETREMTKDAGLTFFFSHAFYSCRTLSVGIFSYYYRRRQYIRSTAFWTRNCRRKEMKKNRRETETEKVMNSNECCMKFWFLSSSLSLPLFTGKCLSFLLFVLWFFPFLLLLSHDDFFLVSKEGKEILREERIPKPSILSRLYFISASLSLSSCISLLWWWWHLSTACFSLHCKEERKEERLQLKRWTSSFCPEGYMSPFPSWDEHEGDWDVIFTLSSCLKNQD